MAEKDIVFEADENTGEIKIANEVVLIIAAQSLNDIKGIHLAASAAEGLVDKLVKKNVQRGIRIYLNDDAKEVDVDVHVNIDYGVNIPEISWTIQEAVKKNIETMTDISVNKVNVFVDGVFVEKELKTPKAKRIKNAPENNIQSETDEQDETSSSNSEEVLSDDADNFDVI